MPKRSSRRSNEHRHQAKVKKIQEEGPKNQHRYRRVIIYSDSSQSEENSG